VRAPGEFDGLRGADLIDDVVMVDQTSIGRTTRSNPASYVGAFDAIRDSYAAEPASQERKYSAGTFSFNSGTGAVRPAAATLRACGDAIPLATCICAARIAPAAAYRSEVLDIKREGADGRRANIAEVLEMTVTQACAFFADSREIISRLAPLADVGLEYVKLGQPVPTLSGGEAQRLKLAGHLASAGALHRARLISVSFFSSMSPPPACISRTWQSSCAHSASSSRRDIQFWSSNTIWMSCVRPTGSSILGPRGGDRGGNIVCVGTPAQVRACAASFHWGCTRSLRGYPSGSSPAVAAAVARCTPRLCSQDNGHDAKAIVIHRAREHNLKEYRCRDSARSLSPVITGVSGSGKSTLAFDILFNEGQRRYLESLTPTRGNSCSLPRGPSCRCDLRHPPTVAIEQRTSRGGRKHGRNPHRDLHFFYACCNVKLGTSILSDALSRLNRRASLP